MPTWQLTEELQVSTGMLGDPRRGHPEFWGAKHTGPNATTTTGGRVVYGYGITENDAIVDLLRTARDKYGAL